MKVSVSLFVLRSTIEEDLADDGIKTSACLLYVAIAGIETGSWLAVAADDCSSHILPAEKRNRLSFWRITAETKRVDQ